MRATNAFKRNNESTVELFDLLRQFRWAPDSRARKLFSPPANHRANKIKIQTLNKLLISLRQYQNLL